MKKVMGSIARMALGDYALYRIFSKELAPHFPRQVEGFHFAPIETSDEVLAAPDEEVRSTVEYFGPDAYGHGVWHKGVLVCACWVWAGERYRKERNFWPLKADEGKIIQITTAASMRNRGIAAAVVPFVCEDMRKRGFKRLFGRVWHSNYASVALCHKSGWQEKGIVIEFRPLRLGRRPWRFVLRKAEKAPPPATPGDHPTLAGASR